MVTLQYLANESCHTQPMSVDVLRVTDEASYHYTIIMIHCIAAIVIWKYYTNATSLHK